MKISIPDGWKINPDYVNAKGLVVIIAPGAPSLEDQLDHGCETQDALETALQEEGK